MPVVNLILFFGGLGIFYLLIRKLIYYLHNNGII